MNTMISSSNKQSTCQHKLIKQSVSTPKNKKKPINNLLRRFKSQESYASLNNNSSKKSNSQNKQSKPPKINQKLKLNSNRINPCHELSHMSTRKNLSNSNSKRCEKILHKNYSENIINQKFDKNEIIGINLNEKEISNPRFNNQVYSNVDNSLDNSIDNNDERLIPNDESIQELNSEENVHSVDVDDIDNFEIVIKNKEKGIIDISSNNNINNINEENNTDYNNIVSLEIQNENLLRQFLQSARKGDKELFLDLLAKIVPLDGGNGDLINYQDERGQTALHYAADEGNLKIVEILIKSNADLNIKSSIKRTPLHISCLHGYFDISKDLIENGALIYEQDNEKNTPIHLCAMGNHIELLKYLLVRCPQIDVSNIYGKTPLDVANSEEIRSVLKDYLSKGESKYQKIKIHNVTPKTAITMQTGNKNPTMHKPIVKGVLFNHDQNKKKVIHSQTNSSGHNYSSYKERKSSNNFHTDSHNPTRSNLPSNNININISTNMCNVLNLSEQKNKKVLNTQSSTGNNKGSTTANTLNSISSTSKANTKTNIVFEPKVRSPQLSKKSISKQIFHSKNYNTNKALTDLKSDDKNNSNNILKMNAHFKSPENIIKKQIGNRNKEREFSKAKSKPNFLTSDSKLELTKQKSKIMNINSTTTNKANHKITFKVPPKQNIQSKTHSKKRDIANNIKNVVNVEINLNDVSSSSNNSLTNSNFTNAIDNTNSSLSKSQEQTEEKISPEMFTCHALLGRGSFGSVYLVKMKKTNKFYAMKVLSKTLIMKQNIVKYAMTERNVLSITSHPFIVKLNYAFQTEDKLFLILDYCPGGDLAVHLSKEKRFKETRAKMYLCEIILALGDLHKHDIIFRDLKPDNIVLDSKGHAMLTDFGLSKEGIFDGNITKSFCGSIAYLAPEMLKRKGHGKAVDWYLLGVLFYEMLVGIPPYFIDNQEMLLKNIEKGDLQIPRFISEKAKTLLKALLKRDPSQRLGYKNDVEEVKTHEYFRGVNWKEVYERKLNTPIPKEMRKIKNDKGLDIAVVLEEEDKGNTVNKEIKKKEIAQMENTTAFNGWTFIMNEDIEKNKEKEKNIDKGKEEKDIEINKE